MNARNLFPVGRIRKTYVMASESVRWQWIRRDCTESSPRSTLDFRSRISGLETNPFTLYWSRPCGLWPNKFPPSPPSTRRHSIITLSRRPEQGNAVCSLLSREILAREPHTGKSSIQYVRSSTKLRVSPLYKYFHGYSSVTKSRSFVATNEYV